MDKMSILSMWAVESISELLREKYIDFNKVFNKESDKKSNKKNRHIITDKEWYECRKFFNFSCSYCGVEEKVEKENYNKSLTKEHVENLGSDYIDNCVTSCNKYNLSKGNKDFEEWYLSNVNYSKEKYDRIIEWLDIHREEN